MFKCENCNTEHDGNYGSGRFCSSKCARGFSTKAKRKEINKKVSNTIKEKIVAGEKVGFVKAGSSLLTTKEFTCVQCNKKFTSYSKDRTHCSNECVLQYAQSVLISKPMSDETKLKISQSVKQNYIDGKQVYGGTTKWYDYKDIRVQGTYELRTCKILDSWKELKKISDWEYTNDRIEYIGLDCKIHNYLLDFKVFNSDGSWYYLETKGYKTDLDDLKWNAVREKGYDLIVWFDEDIKINEYSNSTME